ncbi:MAG: DMT family transporter [Chloroflexi bacterium]|nr:DMT family transporter [Chloroflexota bacterium]
MRPADVVRLLMLAVLWGGSFLFMRIAAPVLGPVVLIALRVSLAGLALLAYAAITRQKLALRRYWRQYLIIGAINSALPFVLIATAELKLPASLAAILNATSPLFGAMMAALWLREPLTLRKIGGIGLGIAGVVILVGGKAFMATENVLLSIGASLFAAACYGLASVYTKLKAAGAPAFGMAAGSQIGASLVLLPLIPFTLPTAQPAAVVVGTVAALALLSTAVAYLLYFRLIVDVGPVRALSVTFLVPVFGLLWGAIFLGEPITTGMLLGGGVILAGIALVMGARLPAQANPGLVHGGVDGERAT